MGKSCKGLIRELVNCIKNTDCVQVEGKSIKECTKQATDCQGWVGALNQCKWSNVDRHYRIRGAKGY